MTTVGNQQSQRNLHDYTFQGANTPGIQSHINLKAVRKLRASNDSHNSLDSGNGPSLKQILSNANLCLIENLDQTLSFN